MLTTSLRAETFRLTAEEQCSIDEAKKLKACDKALNACDKAIEAGQKVIKGQKDIIKVQASEVKELKDQLVEVESERDSIFRNPIVWFLVGVAVGGISYGIVHH